ncbi:peroxidase 27-like [Punica granatum]|uniref:Peroxidase n=2 Tax=Punica granatum TaxID=22663 RepID=A0A218X275_PUNGR|nr:peroxidase 27-like [Punica granatum]OWM78571.1 hypothetical protein CDL15_Pgr002738 [Punica granatum]PKI68604.1 hypothetical protein CRG98_011008 [Punica granatum]
MAAQNKLFHIIIFALVLLVAFPVEQANAQGLRVGFYKKTCPVAEKIIRTTTARYISRVPSLAAPILRMFFHDCFIRGCDASLLLNTTNSRRPAEKDTPPNQQLRGWQVIDAAKAAVEKRCPGVVSCADILALVTRDAVSLIKGPFWQVQTGRRDGRVSNANDVRGLPAPTDNITSLKRQFAAKGLSVKDLVVLSGGHTIGNSHCSSFTTRIYNFTGKGDADPSMDKNYVRQLKAKCKPRDTTTIVQMDPGSSKEFDAGYYNMVLKRRGLFESDSALLRDSSTQAYVQQQARTRSSTFFKDFSTSMIKLGNVGVLTGRAGDIRKKCAFVN